MKSIILAAGTGSRLFPYTSDTPKCMIKFNKKPLLHYQIEVLKKLNITDINIICGYKNEKIKNKNLNKILNPYYLETNMVYSLFCANKIMTDDEDLLITYGDIIYEQKVIENLLDFNAPIVLSCDLNWKRYWSLRMKNPIHDLETFKMNDNKDVTELGKKTNSYDDIEGQFIGIIKIRKDYVKIIKKAWNEIRRQKLSISLDYKKMYMTDFLQYLIDKGNKIKPSFISSGWLEFDTKDDINIYNKLLTKDKLQELFKINDV